MDIKQIGIRGGFVAISLVLWFWTQKIISQKAPKTTGVGDQLHVLTEKLNAWLPAPPGVIWRRPGVPSLLVTYDVGNDFYFSGHTAIAVLAAFELAHTGNPWLAAVGIFIAVGEATTVLILRAHYTMDIFTAAFVAWAAHGVSLKIAPAVDAWLRGII